MAKKEDNKSNFDFTNSLAQLKEIKEQFGNIDNELTSISVHIKNDINEQLSKSNDILKKGVVQTFSRDLTKAINSSNRSINTQIKLLNEANKGANISKRVVDEIVKIETNREIVLNKLQGLQKEGITLEGEKLVHLLESYNTQLDNLDAIQEYNKTLGSSVGLLGLTKELLMGVLSRYDKTGLSAKIISGEITKQHALLLLNQSIFALIVKGTFDASNNIVKFQKQLGLSSNYSRKLQSGLAISAIDSNKLFITSKKLNESFIELSEQTGLIAGFGSETLITYTTLSKQIGLSAEQSKTLTLLSRIQGKHTEDTLKSTIETVNEVSNQHKVGINVKNILKEIGDISESIQVSLGKSPEKLAEAAAQAKILGLNLSEVDKIADSLLDFESSIVNELEAELLLGVNLNLERARLLALNNDLTGLAKELTNQEELRLAFSKGNRIQQEAAAKAIGISRDQLAKMVLHQDLNNMLAEDFIDTYGKATYESLQAQSASEKFSSSLEKIKGIIGDIGIIFTPIIEGFATFVGYISQSKTLLTSIGGIMVGIAAYQGIILAKQGLLLAKSMALAVSNIFSGQGKIPVVGIAAAIAGVAAMFAMISKASSFNIGDDIISPGYGSRVLSTPEGTISLNNKDTIIAGTNLGANKIEPTIKDPTSEINRIEPIFNNLENGIINNIASQPQIIQEPPQEPIKVPDNKKEFQKTNDLLKQILEKSGIVQIDSVKAGTAFSMGTYQVQ